MPHLHTPKPRSTAALHALGSRHLVWLGFAVLSLAGLMSPGCSCSEGTLAVRTPCTSTAQCPGGQACTAGYCVAPNAGRGDGSVSRDGATGDDGSVVGGDSGRPATIACPPGLIRCSDEGVGPRNGTPFNPGNMAGQDPADGVGVDPMDGSLVLDSRAVDTAVIWVANSTEGTVSKFSTRKNAAGQYVELARYVTGPDGGGNTAGNDPSRTSVDAAGDVYVGNRAGQRVTKISVLGDGCPDKNGDGVVTTSRGATALPWGMDECVLWSTALPPFAGDAGFVRAVAAQVEYGVDGEEFPYVWIGRWNRQIHKLDGLTGELLFSVTSPNRNYGFALDAMGNLWISGRDSNPNALGRIDTTRCRDASCEGLPVCEGEAGCDTAVKQHIALPLSGENTYGITVDFMQRVWVAGAFDGVHIYRYDPREAPGSRWTSPSLGERQRGVAADGNGWVWAALEGNGIARINADNPSQFTIVPGTQGQGAILGMAIDFDGKIWGIVNAAAGRAVVITPGPGLNDNTVETNIGDFVGPYTYSDMTGQQLRLATNPRGTYRRVFEGCAGQASLPRWEQLTFDVDAPPNTTLRFRVRTAETRAGLPTAAWVVVANIPPDASPQDVKAKLLAANVTPQRFLEVEVTLTATRQMNMRPVTPRVRAFGVAHTCDIIVN